VTQVTDGRVDSDHSPLRRQPADQVLEDMTMKLNVGGLDRTLRIGAGLVLIGLAATGTVGAWGWIGVVPLLTGAVGFCPVYPLLGLSTCPMKKA
jgi:hypothetical protein